MNDAVTGSMSLRLAPRLLLPVELSRKEGLLFLKRVKSGGSLSSETYRLSWQVPGAGRSFTNDYFWSVRGALLLNEGQFVFHLYRKYFDARRRRDDCR